jgi:glycerol-3-phosphate acyltransferase PlsY
MQTILWTLVAFFLGSIPFSVILGRFIAGKDIRSVADGNPGGMNALRAGGVKTGIPVIILDIGKGFLPVFLAQRYGVSEWDLVPVCLAPILGHAFSPFLRFHGGKALGATAGVWLALIGLWVFPIYAILAVPFTLMQAEDAWSANAGMLALLCYAVLLGETWLIVFTALNVMLIAYTHRYDLWHGLRPRPWLTNLLARRGA